jgi:hypothetical protein
MSSEQFSVGSLVRVREREWVVLPSESLDVLNLKPLSGAEAESCGIFLPLERDEVQPAQFQPPKPESGGDSVAGRLLRGKPDAYCALLYGLNRKQLRYILDHADLTRKELEDILDPWDKLMTLSTRKPIASASPSRTSPAKPSAS